MWFSVREADSVQVNAGSRPDSICLSRVEGAVDCVDTINRLSVITSPFMTHSEYSSPAGANEETVHVRHHRLCIKCTGAAG